MLKNLSILSSIVAFFLAFALSCVKDKNVTISQEDALPVIQSFFTKAGQSLVSGKPPTLDEFTDTGKESVKSVIQRKYYNRPYNLASFTGEIRDLQVITSGDSIKVSFNYYSILHHSKEEISHYQGQDEYTYDRDFFEAYLIKQYGKLKISYIRMFSDTDSPLNEYDLLPSNGSSQGKVQERMAYTYNRSNAISYATTYTIHNNSVAYKGYNLQYIYHPQDCANFVSQCISRGGIPYASPYSNPTYTNSWWYNNKNTSSTSDDSYSNSWVSADKLYNFLIYTNKGYVVTDINSMNNGDLVFAKWVQKDSKGNCFYNSFYNHAMIVTGLKKDFWGTKVLDVKLTYHTSDRVNKLLHGEIIPQSSFSDCANYKLQTIPPIITMVKMRDSG